MNITRVMQTLSILNEYGKTDRGIERLAYTNNEWKAKQYIMEQCESLGMDVRVDSVGNVIARRMGMDDSLPAVAIGSHIDTVYSGGKYDGSLGVVTGLEIVRTIEEEGIKTLHPIELIVFSCEESSRFNFATLGSKAMVGELKLQTIKALKDRNGITVGDAFKQQGLDLDNLHLAERNRNELKSFFEIHIEQGSKLIESGNTIGIVTGIAAPLRLALTIEGKSSHSGTTGMNERQDALLAASEIVLAVEQAALSESQYETVGTVGVLEVHPSAMNVVPGLTTLKIDIRSTNADSRMRVINQIQDQIELVKRKRGVTVSLDWKTEEDPVMMSEEVSQTVAAICEKQGLKFMTMPSGAGHDSMNMAKRWPTSLIFIPSVDGVSHHPDEFTKQDDIEVGVKLLEEVIKSHAIIVKEKGVTS